MQKSKLKHLILAVVAALIVALSAGLSACTIKTNHPRAKITVEFNSVTYDIEYTLYRNMYPATVQHFIELADAGFYDDMIIHNYTSTDWFTGGYSYNADENDDLNYANAVSKSALEEYLEINSKEEAYYNLFNSGAITPTVYTKVSYDKNGNQTVSAENALPALIGEFSANDHTIKKGALSAGLGVLKMYYYSKGATNQKVAVVNSFGEILTHDYSYNCATSIFAMQTASSSSYTATSYCVFGNLRNDDASKALSDLKAAISDYITDKLGGTDSGFTVTNVAAEVDNLDSFAEEGGQAIQTTFTATKLPIIIRTVKITKY